MVSRRSVLVGFLSIPAVVFANRALPRELSRRLTFGPEPEPRALWGQATLGGIPYGDPFRLVAEPAGKGSATLRNPDGINLPPAPTSGELRVEVWSAEYGLLGSTGIETNAPVTSGCDVVIHSLVMTKE